MRPRDQTDMGGTASGFLTTHWSLIEDVKGSGDSDKAYIGQLLERYWKPVYCYLRRKGYGNEEAKDLTQGFFHEVVLDRQLVSRADPAKGRFRTFILHALSQFLIDERRKETSRRSIPKDKLVPLDVADPPALPRTVLDRDPEECFAYAWKSALIDRTVSQVRAECYTEGLEIHWRLFQARILDPILQNDQPAPLKDLCGEHSIESETVASNMLVTVKRRFKAALRRNVRATVLSEEEVDDELREILLLLDKDARKK